MGTVPGYNNTWEQFVTHEEEKEKLFSSTETEQEYQPALQ